MKVRGEVFVLIVWLLSRALVVAGFFSISHPHFNAVVNWDGRWYERIAASGYTYAPGHYSSVAFFPLYPSVVRLLMLARVPFDVAAIIISNASFLAMLWIVCGWLRERFGEITARWSVATLAFFPLSLFGSVAYSEALFMLLSALALRDFDRRLYARAALWTALASLTRPTGLLLLVAFAVAAILEKRKPAALWCAVSATAGVLMMGVYSGVKYGNLLAPLAAEAVWRNADGSGFSRWGVLLMRGTYSFEHWRFQLLLALVILAILFFKRMPAWAALPLWSVVVYWEHWSWDRDFPTAVIVSAGIALWYFRKTLGVAATVYGLAAFLSLVVGGAPLSIDRILYAVIPFSIAIGCFFARFPYAGIPAMTAFSYDLVHVAARFARSDWVA